MKPQEFLPGSESEIREPSNRPRSDIFPEKRKFSHRPSVFHPRYSSPTWVQLTGWKMFHLINCSPTMFTQKVHVIFVFSSPSFFHPWLYQIRKYFKKYESTFSPQTPSLFLSFRFYQIKMFSRKYHSNIPPPPEYFFINTHLILLFFSLGKSFDWVNS